MKTKISMAFIFFAVLSATCGQARAQVDLASIRQDWQAGDYSNVVGSLKQYFQDFSDDDRNFEADFLMATSLSRVPEYHNVGCRYFLSMARMYGQDYSEIVEGRRIVLQTTWNSECPPPPPQAGVHVAPMILPPRRGQVLAEIRLPAKSKLPKKKPDGPLPRGAEEFNGIYELFYEGLRGELKLKGGSGIVIDDVKRLCKLLVRIDGDHIVFYAIGLNGENADLTGGQKFDGYLMPRTHDSIAGLTWSKGRPSGFYAIRSKKLP